MPASPVSACSESSAGTVRQPFFAGPDGVEPAFGCRGAAGMIVSGYGCITYVFRRCAGKKLFSSEFPAATHAGFYVLWPQSQRLTSEFFRMAIGRAGHYFVARVALELAAADFTGPCVPSVCPAGGHYLGVPDLFAVGRTAGHAILFGLELLAADNAVTY